MSSEADAVTFSYVPSSSSCAVIAASQCSRLFGSAGLSNMLAFSLVVGSSFAASNESSTTFPSMRLIAADLNKDDNGIALLLLEIPSTIRLANSLM
jgi:hypothetical protein